MDEFAIALDKATARRYDANGYLHVDECNITKEAVDEYYGREIVGARDLRLLDHVKYMVYRPGDELAKAAETANLIPVLDEHDGTFDAENYDPSNVIGAVGSEAEFRAPYLVNSIAIHNKKVIRDIESGYRTQLSCGYRYKPVLESGEFNGQPYDIKMTDIRFNHVALVRVGRAGEDVRVADSGIAVKGTGNEGAHDMADMNNAENKADALNSIVKGPAQSAEDQADPVAGGGAGPAASAPAAAPAAAPAQDAGGSPEIAAIEAQIAQLQAKLAALTGGAADADPESEKKEDDGEAKAMDSKAVADLIETRLREQRDALRRRDAAIQEVAGLLGNGNEGKLMALDSAEEVYRYGLRACKVEAPKETNLAGLKGMIAAFQSGRRHWRAEPAGMSLDAAVSGEEKKVADLIKNSGISIR